MALHFKRKESVRKALKRIARRRTEKAIAALEQCEKVESVHTVRKEIKQLRALFRLTCDAVSRSDFKRCWSRLHEAAVYLAPARDASVRVRALADLASHYKGEVTSHSFQRIKEGLAADCRREQAHLCESRAVRQVEQLLRKFCAAMDALKLQRSGWRAIGPGIKRSYRDGRDGYRLTRRTGRPDDFHEWRKRVKDLFYQMGLLCAIWPEQMNAAQAELDTLGECLGDAHDLDLLSERRALKRFRKWSEAEAETLSALVERRQEELQHSALMMGARFYQEKPSIFCKRLRLYWKRWRRERKQLARV